jgi:hypothetical protein
MQELGTILCRQILGFFFVPLSPLSPAVLYHSSWRPNRVAKWAGEGPDSNQGLLHHSQMRYLSAASPAKLFANIFKIGQIF